MWLVATGVGQQCVHTHVCGHVSRQVRHVCTRGRVLVEYVCVCVFVAQVVLKPTILFQLPKYWCCMREPLYLAPRTISVIKKNKTKPL